MFWTVHGSYLHHSDLDDILFSAQIRLSAPFEYLILPQLFHIGNNKISHSFENIEQVDFKSTLLKFIERRINQNRIEIVL